MQFSPRQGVCAVFLVSSYICEYLWNSRHHSGSTVENGLNEAGVMELGRPAMMDLHNQDASWPPVQNVGHVNSSNPPALLRPPPPQKKKLRLWSL